MPENAVVRARIKEEIKSEASIVLATIGLTVSDAFRLLLTRIAKDKIFPFEPLVPDDKALDVIRKEQAMRSKLVNVKRKATHVTSITKNNGIFTFTNRYG